MEYENRHKTVQLATWETGQLDQEDRIGLPLIGLALLITSYYYVLPLGRFMLGSLATDYRVYDFVFIVFFLFFGLRYWPHLRQLQRDRSGFHYWAAILLLLVWLSLLITLATSGITRLLPGMIRAIRFTAYFLAAGYVVVLVDNPRRYRFILGVIYTNIVFQAVLAFAQDLGWLSSFWSSYYLALYGEMPVGTLSPHHKQIGVVMLLGIALTLSFLRVSRFIIPKLLLLALMAIMLMVSVFAQSRTAWLGIGALALGYLYIYRQRAIGVSTLAVLGVLLVLWLARDLVQEPIQENINVVFIDRIERFGFEGIAGDRLKVYDNFAHYIRSKPYFLLIGAGFQNVMFFIHSAGAHNNYAQAWFELGIVGFMVYIAFLVSVLRTLLRTAQQVTSPLENTVARDSFAAFVGVLATMLVGETLWAQGSMFTLTGQIMTLMALATSPFYWNSWLKTQDEAESDLENPVPGLQRQ